MIPLLAFMGGAAQGYMDRKDKNAEDERRAKFDQITLDRAAREKKSADREDAMREELDAAGRPVAPQEVATKADYADNIDVGSDPSATVPGGFRVGMKSYTDRAEADKAAAALNTPDAIRARQIDVTRKYDPTRADQMEVAGMQLAETKEAAANRKYDNEMFTAATQGPKAFTKWLTDSGSSPTQGDVIYSPDGSKFRFATKGPDGTLTPIAEGPMAGEFPANADLSGLAYKISRAIPVQAKLAHFDAIRAAEASAKQKQAEFDQKERIATKNNETTLTAARIRADAKTGSGGGGSGGSGGGDGANPTAKMPPAVKLQYERHAKDFDRIGAAIVEAQAKGEWDSKSPNAQALLTKQAVAEAKMNEIIGVYLPKASAEPAADPLGLFTPQPAADRRAPPQAAAPMLGMQGSAQAAPAPEVPRTPRAPMASLPASMTGSDKNQARLAAMASRVPDAQRAFDAAAQQVKDAASKGPMFVARAREELTRARAALVEAKTRAGN